MKVSGVPGAAHHEPFGRAFAPAHGALQTRDHNAHCRLYGPGSALQHDAKKRHVAVRPGHTNIICLSYFWTGVPLGLAISKERSASSIQMKRRAAIALPTGLQFCNGIPASFTIVTKRATSSR